MEFNQYDDSIAKNTVKLVFCLSIDMIGSTKAGIGLSTQKLDKFNIALADQIKPHIEKLDLSDSLIKFTGDGWLVMTEITEKVPALCCLATIMSNRFQEEMSQTTGITMENIPSLRLSICFGRDILIELPDRHKDWVGDSARRATRACGICYPNEIIIDETIRGIVFRDFNIKSIDTSQRLPEYQPRKMEEELILYNLGELKIEATADSEAPEYFVYTLSIIGKIEDAKKVAQKVSERLENEANRMITDKETSLPRILLNLNKVIANLPDYSSTIKILESMRGFNFNTITYNTLINKAPDYNTARERYDEMVAKGILPNVFTYNTLIKKSSKCNIAKELFDEMKAQNIQPDAVTYNILIKKSSKYNIAKELFDEMKAQDIQPDVITYNTLINKAPDNKTAKALMDIMQKESILPNVVTYNTIINNAHDFVTAIEWFDEMVHKDVLPDIVTYGTLIYKAPDYDTAIELFDEMVHKGDILPNASTYSTIINKAPNFEIAKSLINMMRKEAILPDIGIYKTLHMLIKDIPSPDNAIAKAWVDKMQREGNYILLINKTSDFKMAEDLVNMMREEDIMPDVFIYNRLINKAPNYETTQKLMDMMREDDILPDVVTYNTLIKKATDYETAKDLMDMMREDNILPDVVTKNRINELIIKATEG